MSAPASSGPAARGRWTRRRDRAAPTPARTATGRRFASVLAAARADLALIRSLESLAASYARESFNRGGDRGGIPDAPYRQAVLAAYALRWIELSVAAGQATADPAAVDDPAAVADQAVDDPAAAAERAGEEPAPAPLLASAEQVG